jgi:acyl dehydratase
MIGAAWEAIRHEKAEPRPQRGDAMNERGTIPVAEMKAMAGKEIGVSDWFEISQATINAFADITEDWQFIHVDPDRAALTPFGGTIAHGFLTLSLLSAMAMDAVPRLEDTTMGVNYGFDKIRFLSPVAAGARIRGRFKVISVDEWKPGELTLKYRVDVEIEGLDRPALTAEWISRHYFRAA